MNPTPDTSYKELVDIINKSIKNIETFGTCIVSREVEINKLYDSLYSWHNHKLAEARINTYKEMAQLFCGIPTKTLKRADLKSWIVSEIYDLTKQLEEKL